MHTITVIGGGSSAHALIPLLSKTGLKVNLLTRNPKKWSNSILLEYRLPKGKLVDQFEGRIEKISSYPKDVIGESDILILCMPVHAYREVLHQIAPYIQKDKKVYIGTIYGQAGVNWMVQEIIQEFSLKNKTVFAIGLIPWICRQKKYGHSGVVYGAKSVNVAAVSPAEDFEVLNDTLFKKIAFDWFDKGAFVQADNFISLTLSVDNQIIHTARLYGLFLESGGKWSDKSEIPYFYRDFSEKSAEILKDLDDDYSLIRNSIKQLLPNKKFTYMLDYMELDRKTNLTDNTTIMQTFKNSKTLGSIKTPVIFEDDKWVIDRKHRFFYDDIYYGLCIAKWIAEKLKLDVPHIDNVIEWAQNMLNDEIIKDHKLIISEQIKDNAFKYGVPEAYGRTELSQIID